MSTYAEMELEELKKNLELEQKRYDEIKLKGQVLNMSRGRPSKEQLDLTEGMLTIVSTNEDCITEDGTDTRNYGVLAGIPEARKLMGDMMGAPADQTVVCGNASLAIMYDNVSRSITNGICGSTPWKDLDEVIFLCPVPGYDRHFGVTESLGVKMINIPMKDDGPDMDMVEEYVNNNPAVKGIWCVPKYSNPQGIVYSHEVVKRFANLKPAAPDFRIYWDNAYCIHIIEGEETEEDDLLNILDECEKAGNPDIVFMFASTSKVTYAGGGIAAFASSPANVADYLGYLNFHTIGYDKVNMLRHVRFFKDLNGIKEHMKKHAALMKPKFNIVDEILTKELGGLGISSYIVPRGGYFISFNSMNGCAKDIVALAKEAGLSTTGAGAAFPYHKDPDDSNIRIAPSLPTKEQLADATVLFAVCVKIVSLKKLIAERS